MALLLVVLGYASGAVPWGLLFARRAGIDVRQRGSGNIGATNVARTAGARLGVATLAADVLKGTLPVLLARWLTADDALAAASGVAAFAGHVFPVTLRFAGGKGVATALGVLLGLAPAAALVALAVFALAFAWWRYVSVASTLAAASATAAAALLGAPVPARVATLVMGVVVVARHRENYRRLVAGTEPRFELPKRQAVPSK